MAYHGAIDDDAATPTGASAHYLREALDAVLDGRRPRAGPRRAPVGCTIKWSREPFAISARPLDVAASRPHPGGMDADIDALVVGGAAAGLSAALVLGRARVRTLVVDAGEPSNRTAPAIGGLLGQDGTSPGQLYAAGRAQLAALPSVELRQGAVTGIEPAGGGGAEPAFRATLAGGAVTARRVLLAGGMRYAVPDTPGLAELWGGAAFVCPYCHGWEHRDGRIGILGAGRRRAPGRAAALVDDDLVVLADGELDPEDATRWPPPASRPPSSRSPRSRRGWSASPTATSWRSTRSTSWRRWRRATTSRPGSASRRPTSPKGTGIAVADKFGATSVPGVFAAGDAAGAGNVAAAIASGSLAATGLHRSLVAE